MTGQLSDHQPEVWNSGRPKRACIRRKRCSADDRLLADNKTYYKVEVLSRHNAPHAKEDSPRTRHSVSKREEEEKDKGLIVKFKKLRNSELIQLNNEATNFLFPKKDESSDEEKCDECADGDVPKGKSDTSDTEDGGKGVRRFKVEDEGSMDSSCSENKRKRKRRTHAEAFIMDNQKYYKFETPGSRLVQIRYNVIFMNDC